MEGEDLQHLIDRVGGIWELLLLGFRIRWKVGGAYWQWRISTVFGETAQRPGLLRRISHIYRYGCWVYRTKRGR